MSALRVVSLLPAATEIVCALGARDALVGRSHECDFPAGLGDVPVLTRATLPHGGTSAGIDRDVRERAERAMAIYEVEPAALAAASPTVVVTQDLCDVCAVSLEDVRAAVARLASREDVRIVSLRPERLADVWGDVVRVGSAIGRSEAAAQVVARLGAAVSALAARAETAGAGTRPTVLTIEWLAPVMIGGLWMPELVELAGGTALVTKPGEHAPTLGLEELRALDPDVVIVKPCGFGVARTLEELPLFREVLPWTSWRAAREGRVFVADGNAFFNRPGPRLVESLELVAACVHEGAFASEREAAMASGALVRVGPDLAVSRG